MVRGWIYSQYLEEEGQSFISVRQSQFGDCLKICTIS